jgi:hypothetical protein
VNGLALFRICHSPHNSTSKAVSGCSSAQVTSRDCILGNEAGDSHRLPWLIKSLSDKKCTVKHPFAHHRIICSLRCLDGSLSGKGEPGFPDLPVNSSDRFLGDLLADQWISGLMQDIFAKALSHPGLHDALLVLSTSKWIEQILDGFRL